MKRKSLVKFKFPKINLKVATIVAAFYIGLIIGAFFYKGSDEYAISRIKSIMDTFFSNDSKLSFIQMFFSSSFEQFINFFLIFFFGTSQIGIPFTFVLMFYRGFGSGFGLSVVYGYMGYKGLLVCAVCFLPQIIAIFFLMLFMSINSINYSLSLTALKGKLSKSKDLTLNDYFRSSLILYLFSFIPVLYETLVAKFILKLF